MFAVAAGMNSIAGIPVIGPVIAAEPSKLFPHKLLAVASLVAVAALPVHDLAVVAVVAVAALPVQDSAVAAVVAVAALPVVLTEAVPVSFEASSDVTGIVMLPEPSKPVAVPVAAPDRAMVRAVASLVAVSALPELSDLATLTAL